MQSQKSTMEIHRKENCVVISISPKIYSLDVVYSAAYVFLDKAYILLSGEPKKEIMVELRPKEKRNEIEKLGREFSNELINYAFYKKQSEKNAPIRQAILQRALLTSELQPREEEVGKIEEIGEKEFERSDADYLEDPEGIAVPWEEKYGKKAKSKKEKKAKK